MADSLDRLLDFWRTRKVSAAASVASDGDIATWEDKNGVVIPRDLRRYVKRVNGVRHGELLEFDHDGMSFLPLSAMVPEREWANQYNGAHMFVFADYLVQCYWWCAEITTEPRERTRIFLRGGELQLVAESLEEFLDAYMTATPRIHPR